jgi:multiple RNA-binding domain-containing protein 1
VLEWADAESADPEEEIRKMESKVQKQVHKVTLQQLTGRGRTKIKLGEEEDDDV